MESQYNPAKMYTGEPKLREALERPSMGGIAGSAAEIPRQIGVLFENIEVLDKAIECLKLKLAPALGGERPNHPTDDKVKKVADSDVARLIQTAADRIEIMEGCISNLLARIEL